MADVNGDSGDRNRSISEGDIDDPHYAPVITLPEVTVPTNEEDEEVVLKVRAKLYRFDKSDDIPEWKDRGIGELKMLKHNGNKTVRIVMRRDKTLRVCANHFITPLMDLRPKPGHDKAFVYNVPADFSDEQIKTECLAIRFATVDIATEFKNAFSNSQKYVKEECKLYNGDLEEQDSDISDDDDDTEEEEKPSLNDVEIKGSTEAKELTEKLKNLDVAKENGN